MDKKTSYEETRDMASDTEFYEKFGASDTEFYEKFDKVRVTNNNNWKEFNKLVINYIEGKEYFKEITVYFIMKIAPNYINSILNNLLHDENEFLSLKGKYITENKENLENEENPVNQTKGKLAKLDREKEIKKRKEDIINLIYFFTFVEQDTKQGYYGKKVFYNYCKNYKKNKLENKEATPFENYFNCCFKKNKNTICIFYKNILLGKETNTKLSKAIPKEEDIESLQNRINKNGEDDSTKWERLNEDKNVYNNRSSDEFTPEEWKKTINCLRDKKLKEKITNALEGYKILLTFKQKSKFIRLLKRKGIYAKLKYWNKIPKKIFMIKEGPQGLAIV